MPSMSAGFGKYPDLAWGSPLKLIWRKEIIDKANPGLLCQWEPRIDFYHGVLHSQTLHQIGACTTHVVVGCMTDRNCSQHEGEIWS
jgi:hypothetical protein